MAVLQKEGRFASSDKTNTIVYKRWMDEEVPVRAILQLSHGMCEYVDRYDGFAAFMARHGFVVYANNHLGHGKSAKTMDDLGYFGPKEGYRFLVQDLYKMTCIAKKENPGLPVVLLGHSMGSFIARLYLASFSKQVDAAVLVGTAGKNPLEKTGTALINGIVRVRGGRFRSRFLQKIGFGAYNKKIPNHQTDSDWISRERQVIQKYEADPYCKFIFTAAAFKDLFTMLKLASSQQWPYRIRKDLPILLLAGDMDPVGNYGKGVKEVYQKLKNAGVQDVKMKLYKGARHEILNETNQDEVYADILAWANAHIEKEEM